MKHIALYYSMVTVWYNVPIKEKRSYGEVLFPLHMPPYQSRTKSHPLCHHQSKITLPMTAHTVSTPQLYTGETSPEVSTVMYYPTSQTANISMILAIPICPPWWDLLTTDIPSKREGVGKITGTSSETSATCVCNSVNLQVVTSFVEVLLHTGWPRPTKETPSTWPWRNHQLH